MGNWRSQIVTGCTGWIRCSGYKVREAMASFV
jgi:hypothetical protein